MKVNKTVMDANLVVFVQQVVELAKEGWEMDETNPPALYGFYYECKMLKEESEIEEPKKTRAEILADARAAKKAKSTDEAKDAKEE